MGEPFRPVDPAKSGLGMWFGQTDASHDGALTAAEMQQDAARFFVTLDVRRDGEIDPEDVDRYENEIAPEIGAGSFDSVIVARQPITSADYDFNRGTSLAEFTKAALDRFRALDGDHNGRLTLPELQMLQDATWAERRRSKRRSNNSSTDELRSGRDSDITGPPRGY